MGNVAYDLSIYEKKERAKIEIVKKPTVKKNSIRSISFAAKLIITAVIVMVFSSLMIYGNIKKTELTDTINELTREVEEIQSENNRLNAQIAGNLSLAKIEEEAIKLGMSKTEKFQIEYLSLEIGDKIVIPNEDKVQNWTKSSIFSFILEYFS